MPISFCEIGNKERNKVSAITNNADSPYLFSFQNNVAAGQLIESIIKLPYERFIEFGIDSNTPSVKNFSKVAADVNLAITTGSCYSSNIIHAFTKAIVERLGFDNSRNMEITTCLHESVTNAILHGNLQVKSNFRTTGELYEQKELINQRLAIDTYRLKAINIAAWAGKDNLEIAVSDEGDGFDIPRNININNRFPNGRGLMFIHTLADKVMLGEDRRTIYMKFDF